MQIDHPHQHHHHIHHHHYHHHPVVWFNGAPEDHDAAQVSAPGSSAFCAGHALHREPDPQTGGVPSKAG